MQSGPSRFAAADAMKKSSRHPGAGLLARVGMLALALLVSGCATLAALEGPATTDQVEADPSNVPGAAQRELAVGVDLYDKGEYVAAIRSLLTSGEIWRGPLETRVTAQKYVAFSHCLLNRPEPCKQSFSDLLRMKPDFELAAAEIGHPLWGAAFKQAKREATASGPADRALAHTSH